MTTDSSSLRLTKTAACALILLIAALAVGMTAEAGNDKKGKNKNGNDDSSEPSAEASTPTTEDSSSSSSGVNDSLLALSAMSASATVPVTFPAPPGQIVTPGASTPTLTLVPAGCQASFQNTCLFATNQPTTLTGVTVGGMTVPLPTLQASVGGTASTTPVVIGTNNQGVGPFPIPPGTPIVTLLPGGASVPTPAASGDADVQLCASVQGMGPGCQTLV